MNPVRPLRSRLEVKEGWFRQSSSGGLLTTDASMAANVEDRPDRRPPEKHQKNPKKTNQNAKRVAYRRGNSEPIKS